MFRRLVLIFFVCSACGFAADSSSVILALRTVSEQPYAANARIVEVQGARGNPLPVEWRVLLADFTARGGVREVCVQDGKIISERTPLKGFQNVSEMAAIDPSRVKIDAENVYQSAKQEAQSARVNFRSADYTLKSSAASLDPEWTIRLYDEFGVIVGMMSFSAGNGATLQALQLPDGSPVNPVRGKKVGGLIGKIVDFTGSTARKVGDTTLRTVGNVQEFLVGERTIGPQDKE